jgi:nitrate reductase NapD
MSEFNICGVLVHASKPNIQQVQAHLCEIPGVEVHSISDDGRLVVTVESDSRRYVADTISNLHNIDGVLSAAMVYQFSDDINEHSATEGEMSA